MTPTTANRPPMMSFLDSGEICTGWAAVFDLLPLLRRVLEVGFDFFELELREFE
jgi:hypothetical protein